MMSYLLKVIICSAFFLAVYYVMLEKAKMARFNRFYLILALIASFAIPAITFVSEVTVFPVLIEHQEPAFQHTENAPLPIEKITAESFTISSILKIGYLVVAFALLMRFVVNLYRLLMLAKRNELLSFQEHTVVLLKTATPAFSFFHFVFIYEKDYLDIKTEPEVMHHELAHVRQRHSLDIVFVELVSALAWFNPLLFLYRRAIQLNHEFLADEAVVEQFRDPLKYQLLLLEKINQAGRRYSITSSFNYKITQKRLVMITNSLSTRSKVLRAFLLAPFIGSAVLLFSERTLAQVPAAPMDEVDADVHIVATDTVPPKKRTDSARAWGVLPENAFIGGTENGVSPAEMDEYKKLVDQDRRIDDKGNQWTRTPSKENRPRMIELFSKMSRSQQAKQEIVFVNPPRPMTKNIPTASQFENFKDESRFGVWIDNKRIASSALANYKHTDFAQFTYSKLYGKAKEGRSYTHQLNLTSHATFERENERRRQIKDPVALNWVKREVIK